MSKINIGDLFYTEFGRVHGKILVDNESADLYDQNLNSVEEDHIFDFGYHIDLKSPRVDSILSFDDYDRKIIIKYLGDGEFEEQSSHEKMTLSTYNFEDPIWEEIGIYDNNLKRFDGIAYDDPEPIREQVNYIKKNPLVIWLEDGNEDLRPISELNQEKYKKYTDEFSARIIGIAREIALVNLELSISKMDKESKEMLSSKDVVKVLK